MDLRKLLTSLDPARLQAALVNPRAHLQEITLLLGIAVVVLLLLTVVVALALTPPDRTSAGGQARQRTVEGAMRVRRRGRRAGAVIALTLLIAALFGAFVYTGRVQTCAGCHSRPDMVGRWRRSVHSKVACFSCHAAPGPAGAVAARLWVIGDIARSQARVSPLRRDAYVSNDACVRCHGTELGKTVVVASVRMSHREPLAAGASCTGCHAGAAHGGIVGAKASPSMSSCLPCHDGTKASAKCSTCHTEDVGAVNRIAVEDIPKIPPMGKPTTCRGCHPIDSCNKCHGLELPHTEAFMQSQHAMSAAFEKKKVCYKCHDVARFCNQCHRFNADGTSPHNQPFKPVHATSPTACGCHGLSRPAMCQLCHGKTTGP